MLTELSIRDFAIIENIAITFNEGLTVLTGETGAGKSIIIDAIQLLAGGRGSVEYVRHGSKKCEIEGLFTIDDPNHMIYHTAKQFGVEIQDGQVVLQRTITSSGKSICRVNSKLVTLAILREFGRMLIDIHSQHETQVLMNPDHHLEFLDMYEPNVIMNTKEEYAYLYERLMTLKKRYKQLNENEQEMAHRLDLLEFQKNEIEQANLSPNEDLELEEERKTLVNFERVYTSLTKAYNALYGEGKGLEWVNDAMLSMEENAKFDSFIEQKAEDLANYYYPLEDLTYELRNKIENLQYNPERLNEIESRLNEISRLKKKYGESVNDVLEYLASIEEELEEIKNKDNHLSSLVDQIEETEKDALLEAQQLHDIRKRSAEKLTKAVMHELKGLYLEKAAFSISFDIEEQHHRPKLHKNGFDHIQFLISTNPGEPLKVLSKVASGGELSRIMLVLKKIFAKHQGVTSVIFDEVDTGVSGRVAQAMAEKIYQISHDSQVLCITHLPQVAAMADTHKYIEKEEKQNRTITKVRELSRDEQIVELSRMMTGTKLTDTALEHAKELLDSSLCFKSALT
ncbi:DNA repair protein RecN [Oceanobacillus salinisoli]|uniref:DNA repair protein RecN n=1 Tax=Oceanobacillus salinisoli TaxID=2678611 RepID=UPI0012E17FCE|nr:DNA repair protein RecN [Oceanobacillus salinisoli]